MMRATLWGGPEDGRVMEVSDRPYFPDALFLPDRGEPFELDLENVTTQHAALCYRLVDVAHNGSTARYKFTR